jgi:hypothetical protein
MLSIGAILKTWAPIAMCCLMGVYLIGPSIGVFYLTQVAPIVSAGNVFLAGAYLWVSDSVITFSWVPYAISGLGAVSGTWWVWLKVKTAIAWNAVKVGYAKAKSNLKEFGSWMLEFVKGHWMEIVAVALVAYMYFKRIDKKLSEVKPNEAKQEALPRRSFDSKFFYMVFSTVLGVIAAVEKKDVGDFFKTLKDQSWLSHALDNYWSILMEILLGQDGEMIKTEIELKDSQTRAQRELAEKLQSETSRLSIAAKRDLAEIELKQKQLEIDFAVKQQQIEKEKSLAALNDVRGVNENRMIELQIAEKKLKLAEMEQNIELLKLKTVHFSAKNQDSIDEKLKSEMVRGGIGFVYGNQNSHTNTPGQFLQELEETDEDYVNSIPQLAEIIGEKQECRPVPITLPNFDDKNESLETMMFDVKDWLSSNSEMLTDTLGMFFSGVVGVKVAMFLAKKYWDLPLESKRRICIVFFGVICAGAYWVFVNKRRIRGSKESQTKNWEKDFTVQDDDDDWRHQERDRYEDAIDRMDEMYSNAWDRAQDQLYDSPDDHDFNDWAEVADAVERRAAEIIKAEHGAEFFNDYSDFRRGRYKDDKKFSHKIFKYGHDEAFGERLRNYVMDKFKSRPPMVNPGFKQKFMIWANNKLKNRAIAEKNREIQQLKSHLQEAELKIKFHQRESQELIHQVSQREMALENFSRKIGEEKAQYEEELEAKMKNINATKKDLQERIRNANSHFREHGVEPPQIVVPDKLKDSVQRRMYVAKELERRVNDLLKGKLAPGIKYSQKAEATAQKLADKFDHIINYCVLNECSQAQIDESLDKLEGNPDSANYGGLKAPTMTFAWKTYAQEHKLPLKNKKSKDSKKSKPPKKESDEAAIINKTRIDQDKFWTNQHSIMVSKDAIEANRGLFRTKDRVFSTAHPDSRKVMETGGVLPLAQLQYKKIVDRSDAKVKQVWDTLDIAELEVEQKYKQCIPNLNIKPPVKGQEVVIMYTKQDSSQTFLETGKILRVNDDGTFEHDVYTDYGASGCAVTNPLRTACYGWHIRGGEGTSNVARWFNKTALEQLHLN